LPTEREDMFSENTVTEHKHNKKMDRIFFIIFALVYGSV
jgi:hypothetical protein